MTKHSVLAGFAFAAVIALGSLSSATDHSGRAYDGAETSDAVQAAGESRTPDEETSRILRLTESLAQSRIAAAKNPLLLADVGYYEAELAASRRVGKIAWHGH
jgi:hypothetical protein